MCRWGSARQHEATQNKSHSEMSGFFHFINLLEVLHPRRNILGHFVLLISLTMKFGSSSTAIQRESPVGESSIANGPGRR
jgi:hypothetical protein